MTRWHKRVTLGFAAALGVVWALNYWKPPWMSGLKPVKLNETEIRDALANLNAGGPLALSNSLAGALTFSLALPSPDLFTPEALAEAREHILQINGIQPKGELSSKYATIENSWLIAPPLDSGWINLDDLGISTQAFKAHLARRKNEGWKFRLARYESSGGEMPSAKFDPMTLAQLRWLRTAGCLELIDREELISQALCCQVLSAKFPDGSSRQRNWRDVRGLFVTGSGPLLQDTYCQLAALEILGGLDRVDREACIKGILKLHHGRGYFTPPDTEDNWKFQVRGDARDTFSAFESLRILGALDRVRGLSTWKFRPAHASQEGPGRRVNWDEIEAWIFERRSEQAIHAR